MPKGPDTCATSTKSSGTGIPKPSGKLTSGSFFTRGLHQTLNGRRELRAHALPVGQAILLDAECFSSAGGHRIVKTDTLDETTITAIARVGCNDVIKRALLGATAGQTNYDHDLLDKRGTDTGKDRDYSVFHLPVTSSQTINCLRAAAGAHSRLLGESQQGEDLVAHLMGIEGREAAENLQGATVHIRRSHFPALDTNEFYWVDLIGHQVENLQSEVLGEVFGLMDNGAHPILRVSPPPGVQAGAQEMLIPFVDRFVTSVDQAAKKITVDWERDY